MASVSNIIYGTPVEAKLGTVTGGGGQLQSGAIFQATPATATYSGTMVITYTPGFNKLDSTGQYGPPPQPYNFRDYEKKAGIAFFKSKNTNIILAMWESGAKKMSFITSGGPDIEAPWNWVTNPIDRINDGKKEIEAITNSELADYKISPITTLTIGQGVTLYLPYLMQIERIREPEPEPDPCSIGPGLSSTSIASCIQASSQEYLDGVERDWRRSVLKVNSLNA